MINWDDNAVYDFLNEWSIHSSKHEMLCTVAKDRIQFTDVAIEDIARKKYNHYPKRTTMYIRRIRAGKQIGTLFCRKQKDGKWFLKDGNHRFRALRHEGITSLRIGYDSENKI